MSDRALGDKLRKPVWAVKRKREELGVPDYLGAENFGVDTKTSWIRVGDPNDPDPSGFAVQWDPRRNLGRDPLTSEVGPYEQIMKKANATFKKKEAERIARKKPGTYLGRWNTL